jgi:hypothetical protein
VSDLPDAHILSDLNDFSLASSYWCGLIETDCPEIHPWLFQNNIVPFLTFPFLAFISEVFISVGVLFYAYGKSILES